MQQPMGQFMGGQQNLQDYQSMGPSMGQFMGGQQNLQDYQSMYPSTDQFMGPQNSQMYANDLQFFPQINPQINPQSNIKINQQIIPQINSTTQKPYKAKNSAYMDNEGPNGNRCTNDY